MVTEILKRTQMGFQRTSPLAESRDSVSGGGWGKAPIGEADLKAKTKVTEKQKEKETAKRIPTDRLKKTKNDIQPKR